MSHHHSHRLLLTIARLAAVTFGALLTHSAAAQAGFDCSRATRQIDRAICGWDATMTLDRRMTQAYWRALAAQASDAEKAAVRNAQRAWLAERDKRCGLTETARELKDTSNLDAPIVEQRRCLEAAYRTRIAQLMDVAAPPLAATHVATLPIEPLRAAYPEDWRDLTYQAQFSPDETRIALSVTAGRIEQIWLYDIDKGRLMVASPSTHGGRTEAPDDIAELGPWIWATSGRLYTRLRRPLGKDGIAGAGPRGYVELKTVPPAVADQIAAYDMARARVFTAEQEQPARGGNYADDSHNEQRTGAWSAWAQNKGHGAFDLMVARNSEAPHVVASGGWELEGFLTDSVHARLFHSGDDGLLTTDLATFTTRRVTGAHGLRAATTPIALSQDGRLLLYSARGSCTGDVVTSRGKDVQAGPRHLCLASLDATTSDHPKRGAGIP